MKKEVKVNREVPPIKKMTDTLKQYNPYITFIWLEEKGLWASEWNFKRQLSGHQIGQLIASLELEKAKLVRVGLSLLDSIHKEDGGYQKLEE